MQLLGRDVRGRAGDRAGRGEVRIGRQRRRVRIDRVLGAREPEVGDDRAAVARDQHVLRLDVAVDEAGLVRGGDAVRRRRAARRGSRSRVRV